MHPERRLSHRDLGRRAHYTRDVTAPSFPLASTTHPPDGRHDTQTQYPGRGIPKIHHMGSTASRLGIPASRYCHIGKVYSGEGRPAWLPVSYPRRTEDLFGSLVPAPIARSQDLNQCIETRSIWTSDLSRCPTGVAPRRTAVPLPSGQGQVPSGAKCPMVAKLTFHQRAVSPVPAGRAAT